MKKLVSMITVMELAVTMLSTVAFADTSKQFEDIQGH